MIDTLTLEQRQQLSRERRKSRKRWNRRMRSTEPIDRERATVAIAQVYAHLGLPAPNFLFFPSPNAAWNCIRYKLTRYRWLTRLLRQSTAYVSAICVGSGCLGTVIIFPFLLLYGLLHQLEFLSGFLDFMATLIGLLSLLIVASGLLILLLSPLTEALEQFDLKCNRDRLQRKFGLRLTPNFTERLIEPLQQQLVQQMSPALWDEIAAPERFFHAGNAYKIWHSFNRAIYSEWLEHYGRFFETFGSSESQYCFDFPIASAGQVECYNFLFSVLENSSSPDSCQVLLNLLQQCSFILPFERVCIVCDRPTKLSLDSKNRLHALAEPAVQFADGTGLYFNSGTRIYQPPVHPVQP